MDDQSTFQPQTSSWVQTDSVREPERPPDQEPTVEPTAPSSDQQFEVMSDGADPQLSLPGFGTPSAPAIDPVVEPVANTATWSRIGSEILSGVQTLFSAAVYATLIVTFCFQVARVDGLSMAPTLQDHDRLIVNKLVYEVGEPRPRSSSKATTS
jgi:hypothetical protein